MEVRPGRLVALGVVLALGASCGGTEVTPGTEEHPRVIRIGIEHSAFSVEDIDVVPGEVVRFVLSNTDPIDHEFILGDDAVQERHEDGEEAEHGAVPGEVSIPAGSTAETTYTFGGAGTLTFACHLPGHFAYGMVGRVIIA
jgi:uncharacterized cupredoxin-like copper-binding protein